MQSNMCMNVQNYSIFPSKANKWRKNGERRNGTDINDGQMTDREKGTMSISTADSTKKFHNRNADTSS